MANFAELKDNVVQRVIVIDNEKLVENGIEVEQKGIDFCQLLFGNDTEWKQTSYNTVNGVHVLGKEPFRGTYAAIGWLYSNEQDKFYPPSPHKGWIFDFESMEWVPPIPMPTSPGMWEWDEEELNWVK